MLSYDISLAGEDSLYHFLYRSIRDDILAGRLRAEDKLPSKRPFAVALGVSVVTVENAYEQLLTEGFVYSLPRKGFFVAAIEEKNIYQKNSAQGRTAGALQESRESRWSEPSETYDKSGAHEVGAFQNHNKSAAFGCARRSQAARASRYIADFIDNQVDAENFPFSTWAKLTRKVLCEQQNELLTRSPNSGVLPLRRAIAKMLFEFRGMRVDPEQIVVGAGTDILYDWIVQLLGFDKKYGVEDPGYSKISKIYRKLNVVCNFIPLDDNGVRIDQLEETCTDVAHLSPSHHFPTGKVMPISRRYELLSWASKSSNRYIVEDEYDSEFRMVGRPIPALQSIDAQDKTIYINSFSKTLASTVRVGYMVLPKTLAKKFREEFSFYTCSISNMEQYVLAKYICDGHYEKHINRMRNFYRHRRDALLATIRTSKLRHRVEIAEQDAGLHFILKVNTTLTDEEFCKRAQEKGVRIGALSDYYTAAAPSQHQFIVNYSNVQESSMKRAIHKLEEIIA